jgi:hypothetical protein
MSRSDQQARLVKNFEDPAVIATLAGTGEVEIVHDEPNTAQQKDERGNSRNGCKDVWDRLGGTG